MRGVENELFLRCRDLAGKPTKSGQKMQNFSLVADHCGSNNRSIISGDPDRAITSGSPTIREITRHKRVYREQSANPEALLPGCPSSGSIPYKWDYNSVHGWR